MFESPHYFADEMQKLNKCSRRQLDRLEKAGAIPKRVWLSPRVPVWIKEEVHDFISRRPRGIGNGSSANGVALGAKS